MPLTQIRLMTIREIIVQWAEENFTFIDETAMEQLIAALEQREAAKK